ncbi:MAG: hypothetical protein JXB62_13710 [Pirellulales bacterium]|nr:hypothetical protein [Pirellulales bacterium]
MSHWEIAGDLKRTVARRAVVVAALIVAACGIPSAEAETPYQPAGAPADPKVPARWNRYHDYTEATELMRAMVAAHPKRVRLQSLGKSYGGREMWLMTITNRATGDDRSKPAFWIGGAIHANEIQGTQVTLYTAWYLLEMYGRNELITRLLDERTFYLVPMMSPDSRDAHMHRPNTSSSPRSGQVPVDDDRDGLFDEDGPDDLDGDGHITRMRVHDPNGRYKPHPKYPDLMIPAEDDERGQYRLLGSEGFDNDGDGRMNEDGDGYYDPNRDWPWRWQPKHIQRGAHRYPLSLPENRAVADFVLDHPNIAGAQQYHNSGGMILRGPGTKLDRIEPADKVVYDAVAKNGQLVLPGYRYINTANDLYEVYGGEGDWFYMMRGVFRYTNELFTSWNYFRKPSSEGFSSRGEQQQAFDKYLLFGEGTVPWKKVDHPQYGKIEVGGLKKNWGRQPPSFLLEEECHRNMAFTLYHADQMPKVEIQSIKMEPVAGDLTQVTAVVANPKLIPTHAAVDLKHKITPPDVVSIDGKNLTVVLGLRSPDAFFRSAPEQKRRPEAMRIENISGMGAVHVRWLVRGEGPYTVAVRSVKGGSDRRRVRRDERER